MHAARDARHTLVLAILVLFGGRYLTRRVPFLRNYSIPEPVTGGLIASLTLTAFHLATGLDVTFDLSARDTLLVAFFTTVGLSARVGLLAAGGAMLAILTGVAVANLVLQNVIAVGLMPLFGLPPAAGLMAGSAALSGGHGTVLAWAAIIARDFALPWRPRLGAAAATFGLIAGGVLGGPLGQRLDRPVPSCPARNAESLSVGQPFADEAKPRLDVNGVLTTVLVIVDRDGGGGSWTLNDAPARAFHRRWRSS